MRSAIQRLSLSALLTAVGIPAAAVDFAPVALTIDLSEAEDARTGFETLRGLLVGQDFVALDLSVRLDPAGGSAPTLTAGGVAEVAVDCADGFGRIVAGPALLHFGAPTPDTHLLLSAKFPTGPAETPFTVACAYDAQAPEAATLRVRGWFHVSMVRIPTAEDVVLYAVRP